MKSLSQHIIESVEQPVNESGFDRLPQNIIDNEVYQFKQNAEAFADWVSNGNDVNVKDLKNLIKLLQSIESKVKHFNSADEVKGTVYEHVAETE